MASRFDGSFQVFGIASAAYPVFDGGGAHRWGSRWCTPGRRVIHTASAYSLALLENLVHWNSVRLPPEMRYVVATIPEEVSRAALDPESVPGWNLPDHSVSRPFGDAWYDEAAAAVLVVPSVLSPFEPNILINQNHPDAEHILVSAERPAVLDRRLLTWLADRGSTASVSRAAANPARRIPQPRGRMSSIRIGVLRTRTPVAW